MLCTTELYCLKIYFHWKERKALDYYYFVEERWEEGRNEEGKQGGRGEEGKEENEKEETSCMLLLQVLYPYENVFVWKDSHFQKLCSMFYCNTKAKQFYNPNIYAIYTERFYLASKIGRKWWMLWYKHSFKKFLFSLQSHMA